MNFLKVISGKVQIRENNTLIRTIGNGDAVSADFNHDQSLVIMTTNKGKVEIRKNNGLLIRTIGNGDALTSKFYGTDIAITLNKGKTELRSANGILIRTI